VIGLLALSTLVTVVIDRQILLARVDERVDDSLEQEAREFRRLVGGRDPTTGRPFGDDVGAIFNVFLRRNVPGEGEALFTFVDERPYRSTEPDSLGRELLEAAPALGRTREVRKGELTIGGREVRYLAVPVVIGGRPRGVFVVSAAIGREREQVTDALQVTAAVALAVLLVASVLAFFAAGRVLAPLREVTETARSTVETDLSRRIPVEGHDEIAELARTFNAMLDRLEEAFATQKDFLSDAGHELRTPITVIRGHLELLGDDPGEREEVIALVCDELDRMARLVDDLLLLARADRSDFLRLEEVDLATLTDELQAKAAGLADRGWELEATGRGLLRADRQRLTQAMMNLLRNAAEHTSEGDRVALGSGLANGHARLWVSDSGPGVPEEDRERIFERFDRGSVPRAAGEGTGLGLAIVRAIAEAHDGSVTVTDAPGGRGARFTIAVPTAPRGDRRAQ
jgi:signal transduction histidine kinase